MKRICLILIPMLLFLATTAKAYTPAKKSNFMSECLQQEHTNRKVCDCISQRVFSEVPESQTQDPTQDPQTTHQIVDIVKSCMKQV